MADPQTADTHPKNSGSKAPDNQTPDAQTPASQASDTPAAKKEDYSMMPSDKLRSLRDSFRDSIQPMEEKINDLTQQIAAAEEREYKEKCDAELAELLPDGVAEAAKDHDFIFLINNSKEGGSAPDSFLGRAVEAAYETRKRLDYARVASDVKAHFWGIYGDPLLKTQTGRAFFTSNKEELHTFLPAAKKIVEASMPDIANGRHQNYIIICEGRLSDSTEQSVKVLEAAAQLNPKATFDFVVCNEKRGTLMDLLVEKFRQTKAGETAGLVLVEKPEEIVAAVFATLNRRLANKHPAPRQAPAPKPSL